jgi:hypothetical protein
MYYYNRIDVYKNGKLVDKNGQKIDSLICKLTPVK